MKHCQRHGPEKDPYCVDCWKDERERDALCPSDATACSSSEFAVQYWRTEKGWCESSIYESQHAAEHTYERMVAAFPGSRHRVIERITTERVIREPNDQNALAMKEKSDERLAPIAGSPSSDTPDTNHMASMRRTTQEWIIHSQDLEHQKNLSRKLYETEVKDMASIMKTLNRVIKERDDAAELLADIMRDEVNHQDEAEKWLRAYAPQHLFSENVKGHASPEHAPKIDQTASSASHVPACYPSSFLEGAESGNQSGGFIPTNEDGTIRFGTEVDGDVGSSCACDSDARNIVDVDPSLHRATYDVPVSISDVNELWEWHEIGMIMGMMEDRGCRELMLHWSDLFGGDQSRFVEFMEYLQRGSSFMGRLSIRITPRGPWIDISLDNAKVEARD